MIQTTMKMNLSNLLSNRPRLFIAGSIAVCVVILGIFFSLLFAGSFRSQGNSPVVTRATPAKKGKIPLRISGVRLQKENVPAGYIRVHYIGPSGETSKDIKASDASSQILELLNASTPSSQPNKVLAASTTSTSSADLSAYVPPRIGDQGTRGSCVAWATGYYQFGWYARKYGYYPDIQVGNNDIHIQGFAPMSIYSVMDNGKDAGSYANVAYKVMMTHGIDAIGDYIPQGDYNYWQLPTTAQSQNAKHYTISNYVYTRANGNDMQDTIEKIIAGGNPVAIGVFITAGFNDVSSYNNAFLDYSKSDPYYDANNNPTTDISKATSIHEVTGFKYDSKGLWVLNAWGSSWGNNGWAELSWNYLKHNLGDLGVIVPSLSNSQGLTTIPTSSIPPPAIRVLELKDWSTIKPGSKIYLLTRSVDIWDGLQSMQVKIENPLGGYSIKCNNSFPHQTQYPFDLQAVDCIWSVPPTPDIKYVVYVTGITQVGGTGTVTIHATAGK